MNIEEKINKILSLNKEIILIKNNVTEKENQILSCINLIEKAVNQEDKQNISLKQKRIAFSLIKENRMYNKKKKLLKELCKSLKNEKYSVYCIENGVKAETLKQLKSILKRY